MGTALDLLMNLILTHLEKQLVVPVFLGILVTKQEDFTDEQLQTVLQKRHLRHEQELL